MLYSYQQRWIADKSRFKIGHFARQTGKTFTTTLEIVQDCLEAEARGKKSRWIILSRGERQAKEAMEEGVKLHCKAYQAAFEALDYDIEENNVTYKAHEVIFPGGSRITALPANPDTARGFSANVFLDEFAFHKDSRKIWAALFPVISAGFKLRITSTGNGKSNKFYELMTSKSKLWSRHAVNIHQAITQSLPRDAKELEEGIGDPDIWAQEYLNEWLDEASAWLPYDLIYSVEHEQAGLPEHYSGNPVYIGNDIARRNDLWVAWVWEQVGDVLWTREIVAERRIAFHEQDAHMDRLFEKYNVARLCVDQTGMGEKPVEDYQRKYGEYRVEGILFTSASKLNLANTGREYFEDKRCRIPQGDTALRSDLHSLKKVTTPTGNVRFDVNGDGSSHADRTWAAFLGLTAAANPEQKYAYIPVHATKERAGSRLVQAARGFKRSMARRFKR